VREGIVEGQFAITRDRCATIFLCADLVGAV